MTEQLKSTAHHIALTGHRPPKLGGYNINTPAYKKLQADLEQYIRYSLSLHKTVICHSGLALGADTVWSKAILNMRNEFPTRVLFHAEIPMLNQPSRWPSAKDRLFWQQSVESADFSTIYGEVSETLSAGKLLDKRNNGMVDHCDELLAIFDGSKSGTGNAVNYAERTGKNTIHIHPSRYFS